MDIDTNSFLDKEESLGIFYGSGLQSLKKSLISSNRLDLVSWIDSVIDCIEDIQKTKHSIYIHCDQSAQQKTETVFDIERAAYPISKRICMNLITFDCTYKVEYWVSHDNDGSKKRVNTNVCYNDIAFMNELKLFLQ